MIIFLMINVVCFAYSATKLLTCPREYKSLWAFGVLLNGALVTFSLNLYLN